MAPAVLQQRLDPLRLARDQGQRGPGGAQQRPLAQVGAVQRGADPSQPALTSSASRPAPDSSQNHSSETATRSAPAPSPASASACQRSAGHVRGMSVREYRLLTAVLVREGRIVSRTDLYRQAWDAPPRDGDRSVDVQVHKLRVKLEQALPGQTFIHTHFRCRFAPEPSHPFHTGATGP